MSMAPGNYHIDISVDNKEGNRWVWGGGGGEGTTNQRLNKASGFHESIVYYYKAHGADASKADCTCTITLTADW